MGGRPPNEVSFLSRLNFRFCCLWMMWVIHRHLSRCRNKGFWGFSRVFPFEVRFVDCTQFWYVVGGRLSLTSGCPSIRDFFNCSSSPHLLMLIVKWKSCPCDLWCYQSRYLCLSGKPQRVSHAFSTGAVLVCCRVFVMVWILRGMRFVELIVRMIISGSQAEGRDKRTQVWCNGWRVLLVRLLRNETAISSLEV